jgi:hypothetical protein
VARPVEWHEWKSRTARVDRERRYTVRGSARTSERSRRTRARKEVAATPDERIGTSYSSGRAADSGGGGEGTHRLR